MTKKEYTITDLKNDLSGILRQVQDANEIIIITNRGFKVCAIVPIEFLNSQLLTK
jgi:prevent-host-death family protein